MALDYVLIAGILGLAVLVWLFLKLAFGVGGSREAFTVVLVAIGLMSMQVTSPWIMVPALAATVQASYKKSNSSEVIAMGAIVLAAYAIITTNQVP